MACLGSCGITVQAWHPSGCFEALLPLFVDVAQARTQLLQLRRALQEHGLSATNTDAYIMGPGPNGAFSYADIAMATAVDMLAPPTLPNSVAMPFASMSAPLITRRGVCRPAGLEGHGVHEAQTSWHACCRAGR